MTSLTLYAKGCRYKNNLNYFPSSKVVEDIPDVVEDIPDFNPLDEMIKKSHLSSPVYGNHASSVNSSNLKKKVHIKEYETYWLRLYDESKELSKINKYNIKIENLKNTPPVYPVSKTTEYSLKQKVRNGTFVEEELKWLQIYKESKKLKKGKPN